MHLVFDDNQKRFWKSFRAAQNCFKRAGLQSARCVRFVADSDRPTVQSGQKAVRCKQNIMYFAGGQPSFLPSSPFIIKLHLLATPDEVR
jgi:hypothetical protein